MDNTQKFFGFTFASEEKPIFQTPVTPDKLESTVDITGYGNFFSSDVTQVDVNNGAETENELIRRYREMSYVPEVDKAIEEITAEAIVTDRHNKIVTVNLDNVQLSDSIKKKINAEFQTIYKLLSFHNRGYDIFRRWYIDGRIHYHPIIDPNNPRQGIQELRYVDPRKVKKVREIIRKPEASMNNMSLIQSVREYYLYSEKGVSVAAGPTNAVKLTKESIVTATSGLIDPTTQITVSYLHKALRAASNLRMMEDAMLIYRLARAPERRIFYVDTGTLPKGKAEQYVQEIANKYRSKAVYDPKSGEIKNDTRYLAMTEDFWIPRQEGTKGTVIDTLQGGQQVGETGESDYFKQKLYESLNVPMSRFQQEQAVFSQGTEITRDELRFARFIDRLRVRFTQLFEELLCRQVILKGIMNLEEWNEIRSDIIFSFAEDNHFSESLDTQVMQGRVELAQAIDAFAGKYFSKEYIMRNVLRMSVEQMQDMLKQIERENLEDLKRQMQTGVNPDAQDTDGNGLPNGQQFMNSDETKLPESDIDKEAIAQTAALTEALTEFLKQN